MKFLLDVSTNMKKEKDKSDIVCGQLLTPLTRYTRWAKKFAIDNGAFSHFEVDNFKSLLKREESHRDDCLWVSCPDVVGNGRRTLEIFRHRHHWIQSGWRVALVVQNGIEDLDIPWSEVDALFVGGEDPWKESRAVRDLIKTAKIFQLPTHAGRVNTYARFKYFDELGVDTCDGSGVAKYDHMLRDIENAIANEGLQTKLNLEGLDAA